MRRQLHWSAKLLCTVLAAAGSNCASLTLAQQSPIKIEQTTVISVEDPHTPHAESWLAQNPLDPRNLVAVANAMPGHIHSETALYYTRDGGKTWHRSRQAGGATYFQGTDPSLAFAPDGTAYYVNEDERVINFFHSTNGGETWGRELPLPGIDHPIVAVDNSDGRYRDRIYVAATGYTFSAQDEQVPPRSIEFAYSDDGGLTFQRRAFLMQKKGSENWLSWSSITDLAVAPDGTVVLMYAMDPPGNHPPSTEFWVMTSSNGGRTFTEPHHVAVATMPSDPAEYQKTACFAKLAIDNSSGPRRGRLYLAYLDLVNGWSRTKVIHSDDLGQTWEEPIEVGANPTHTDQAIPGIGVSQDGVVGVSWYDRRKDTQNECFQGYFSASLDSGLTFLPATSLQNSSTCPKVPGNELLAGAYSRVDAGKHVYGVDTAAERFQNGGETQGLVGLDHGKFLLAWVNGESGVMELVSSALHVNALPLGTDLTDRVKANVGLPEWDLAAHKISVPVSITNVSRNPLQGPFHLESVRFSSIFGELHATNSANGQSNAGATWELVAAPDKSVLPPGATSLQTTLRFEIGSPPPPNTVGQLDIVFRIFDNYKR